MLFLVALRLLINFLAWTGERISRLLPKRAKPTDKYLQAR